MQRTARYGKNGPRALAAGCIFALIASTALTESGGFIEGRLTVAAGSPVQLDDAPDQSRHYARFALVVRRTTGGEEIARTTADREGNYRMSLPAGDYILAVEEKGTKAARSTQQKFTIASGKTIRLDTAVLPNLRAVDPGRVQSD